MKWFFCFFFMPQCQYFIQWSFHSQKHLRKSQIYPFDLLVLPIELLTDKRSRRISHSIYISRIINTKSASSPRNLFYFGRKKFSYRLSVKFFCLHENNPFYRKIKSHSNSIRRNYYFCFPTGEKRHLTSSDFWRQTSIDHAAFHSLLFQPSSYIQHRFLGKNHQRISFFHILWKRKRVFLKFQFRFPLIPMNFIIIVQSRIGRPD